MSLQPLFTIGCMALPDDGVAPPAHGTLLCSEADNADDEALDVVFGGDPGVITFVIVLPQLEPRAAVAVFAAAPVPPRVADPADHPPRRA
jgi:hypothetical protein